MVAESFDVLVVGGGPGGYVAAIRAAQLNLKTALVEREHLGGICLNWGCIPTKALLRSAEINHLLQHLDEYGFSARDIRFDLGKIVARSRAVAAQLAAGVKHLLKKNGVRVIAGHAKLSGRQGENQHVLVEQAGQPVTEYAARTIILASGARPRVLPGLEPDGKLIWTYKQAMVPDRLPQSLAVVGSGAIGVEFASFYHNLGCKVTLIEVLDRILPVEDAEISALAQKAFTRQGIRVLTQTSVSAARLGSDRVTLLLSGAGQTETLTIDRVIIAAGIVGNVEQLGLEGRAIRVKNTHIETDGFLQTGEPGVYAIGDLAGPPWLAHKASHEGVLAVDHAAGLSGLHPIDVSAIPGCTYCRPQIASVGLTEAKAIAAGHTVRVGRFPYQGNGKAIAMGEAEGLIKVVFDDKTGALLGAHLIGAEVTELIQGYVIGKNLETTEADLMGTIFAHPTLSEMMHEAVLDAYGRTIHF